MRSGVRRVKTHRSVREARAWYLSAQTHKIQSGVIITQTRPIMPQAISLARELDESTWESQTPVIESPYETSILESMVGVWLERPSQISNRIPCKCSVGAANLLMEAALSTYAHIRRWWGNIRGGYGRTTSQSDTSAPVSRLPLGRSNQFIIMNP